MSISNIVGRDGFRVNLPIFHKYTNLEVWARKVRDQLRGMNLESKNRWSFVCDALQRSFNDIDGRWATAIVETTQMNTEKFIDKVLLRFTRDALRRQCQVDLDNLYFTIEMDDWNMFSRQFESSLRGIYQEEQQWGPLILQVLLTKLYPDLRAKLARKIEDEPYIDLNEAF